MKQRKKDRRFGVWYLCRGILLAGGLVSVALLFAFMSQAPVAKAVTTTPNKMNFQGRITDASGNPLTGTYDMQFKLYDAASGGTLKWAETRTAANSNAVSVTNGLFSVRLGEGTLAAPSTQLNAVVAANPTLYFEITVGADAAMTPRSQLATSAYAFNSETLDGLDSSAFGLQSAVNTWTNTNTFKVTSTTAVQIQDAGGVTVLNADTSTGALTLGTVGSKAGSLVISGATSGSVTLNLQASGAVYTLALPSASPTTSQCLRSGTSTATNMEWGGCGPGLTVTTMNVTLVPEYAGATFTPSGTNNTGSLSSDFCSGTSLLSVNTTACPVATDEHNFYAWTTTQASAQNYDVYVRWQVPSDYNGSLGSLAIANKVSAASDSVALTVYKSGVSCSTATSSSTSWTTTALPAISGCTIAAGDTLTFKVHLVAGASGNFARAGEITFNYARKL